MIKCLLTIKELRISITRGLETFFDGVEEHPDELLRVRTTCQNEPPSVLHALGDGVSTRTEGDRHLLGGVARNDDERRVVEAFVRDKLLEMELGSALSSLG